LSDGERKNKEPEESSLAKHFVGSETTLGNWAR
jgi:hypothetical protein